MIDLSQRGYVSHILQKRRDFMQLVGIAIGLAFGVDLLASGLTKVLSIPMQTALGGLTVLVVACILGWWTFRSFSFVQIIEGCVFIDTNRGAVCAVPRVLAENVTESQAVRAHAVLRSMQRARVSTTPDAQLGTLSLAGDVFG